MLFACFAYKRSVENPVVVNSSVRPMTWRPFLAAYRAGQERSTLCADQLPVPRKVAELHILEVPTSLQCVARSAFVVLLITWRVAFPSAVFTDQRTREYHMVLYKLLRPMAPRLLVVTFCALHRRTVVTQLPVSLLSGEVSSILLQHFTSFAAHALLAAQATLVTKMIVEFLRGPVCFFALNQAHATRYHDSFSCALQTTPPHTFLVENFDGISSGCASESWRKVHMLLLSRPVAGYAQELLLHDILLVRLRALRLPNFHCFSWSQASL